MKWAHKAKALLPMRAYVAVLIGFGVMVVALDRFNINFAVVCMVNTTQWWENKPQPNSGGASQGSAGGSTYYNHSGRRDMADNSSGDYYGSRRQMRCYEQHIEAMKKDYQMMMHRSNTSGATVGRLGTIDWDSITQSLIFLSTFAGSLLSVYPAGILCDKHSPKAVFGISVFLNIIGTVLLPYVASNMNYWCVMLLRFVQGIGQGTYLPCVAAMASRWSPPEEMSRMLSVALAGNNLAVVLMAPAAANLCTSRLGWPFIFYLTAALPSVWLLLWWIFVTDSPSTNAWISSKERQFLEKHAAYVKKSRPPPTPWRNVLSSKPIWAAILSNFGASLGNYMIVMYLPTYFKEVLYFTIITNGILTFLPQISQFFGKLLLSSAADAVLRHLSPTVVCKSFNCAGLLGMGACILLAGFATCDQRGAAVALLCVGTFVGGAFIPGFRTSLQKLAPPHSGAIQSMSSVYAQLAGIALPSLVGPITYAGLSGWRTVFISVALFMWLAAFVFLIFGRAELEPWCKIDKAKPPSDYVQTVEEKVKQAQDAQ